MENYKYEILITPLSQKDGGGFLASVPDLPGCISDGETRTEAASNIEDAIEAWIYSQKAMNSPIPSPSFKAVAE